MIIIIYTICLLQYSLKTLENWRFSDVFRGYRKKKWWHEMDSWPPIKLIATRLKQLKLLTFGQEQDLGCLIFASFKSNLMQNKKNTIRNE